MMDACRRGCVAVDLDAIAANVGNVQAHLERHAKMRGISRSVPQIMAVVKTDAYGHGAVPIAETLEPLECIYGFAVATAEEAHILRVAGVAKPILVLGYAFPCSYEAMAAEDVSLTVFDYDSIDALAQAAEKTKKRIKIHVKIDTGMGRIGIAPDDEGLAFVERVMREPLIDIEGIFTHFARADERDKASAEGQFAKFAGFLGRIEGELGLSIPLKHCANSAGILELPGMGLDLVRAGIILYGLYPSAEVARDAVCLQPALSLYSTVIYVKTIHAGESVSYGGLFTAEKDTRVATIPIGYGDGYPRSLSCKGSVLICGRKAPILGRVCMDQFMADVSEIPEAAVGSRVTLLGFDGGGHISAEELGELSGRFNYEFVCCLGKRLPRVYLRGGKVLPTKMNTLG